jgi:hypothetical protein
VAGFFTICGTEPRVVFAINPGIFIYRNNLQPGRLFMLALFGPLRQQGRGDLTFAPEIL